MDKVTFTLENDVAVVSLNDGENRFNNDFLDAFLSVMDVIENETSARTMVVTSSHEKIFSNGIDLDWLSQFVNAGQTDEVKNFLYKQNKMFKRLVTFPLIAIAAISGHAFAGGAILCCAFDFRFMRSDRGYFCFPEVDLGIPFLPGMNALLKKAMPMYVVEYMEYTGVRLTADQCAEHHIIQKACPMETLLEETVAFAMAINKRRPVVAEMKKRLNQPIVQAIDVDDVAYIESGRFNIG